MARIIKAGIYYTSGASSEAFIELDDGIPLLDRLNGNSDDLDIHPIKSCKCVQEPSTSREAITINLEKTALIHVQGQYETGTSGDGYRSISLEDAIGDGEVRNVQAAINGDVSAATLHVPSQYDAASPASLQDLLLNARFIALTPNGSALVYDGLQFSSGALLVNTEAPITMQLQ